MSRPAIQSCPACGHRWQFARAVCPACGAADAATVEACGLGTVWSATVVHRAPVPELDVAGGYAIALVRLDEGPRIMCRAEAGLSIGERVLVSVGEDGLPRARHAPARPQA